MLLDELLGDRTPTNFCGASEGYPSIHRGLCFREAAFFSCLLTNVQSILLPTPPMVEGFAVEELAVSTSKILERFRSPYLKLYGRSRNSLFRFLAYILLILQKRDLDSEPDVVLPRTIAKLLLHPFEGLTGNSKTRQKNIHSSALTPPRN